MKENIMPAPLPKEVREKIIIHKQNGEKESDIAKWLLINKSTVTKIWRQYREENTIENKAHQRGRKPAFSSEKLEEITSKIREQPDITLEELVDHFELDISVSALSRKLSKLNLTFKKRRYSQKNNSARTCNGFEGNGWDIFHI
jgi:transposase